jgi:hypothetical protein
MLRVPAAGEGQNRCLNRKRTNGRSSDKGVLALLLRHVFILCAICLILAGCAPPSTLNLEKVPAIKRVGVITRLTEHDLKVFDHTGISNKSYLKYIGGVGPLLLERYFPIDRPIVWAEAQYAMNKSLNGNPEQIKRYIASDVIKSMVDAKIAEKLSKKRDGNSCLLCNIDGQINQKPVSACYIISRKTIFWAALDEVDKTKGNIFSEEATFLLSTKLKDNELHSNHKYIVTLCREHNNMLLKALSLSLSPQESDQETKKDDLLFDV